MWWFFRRNPPPSIQTLSPKFSKKREGGQKISHKRLGVLSKDDGVSLIFTLTNAFWCYLYQCVFFICINHSISILYVFFMMVLIYIYVRVRVYQYIGPSIVLAKALKIWIGKHFTFTHKKKLADFGIFFYLYLFFIQRVLICCLCFRYGFSPSWLLLTNSMMVVNMGHLWCP